MRVGGVTILKAGRQLEMKDIQEMARLEELDEKRANRTVARKFKISEAELERIFLKVAAHRQ